MNPLLWLHFRLVGVTNALIYVGVFVLLVIGGAGISYRSAPATESGRVSGIWLGIITAGQGLFLMIMLAAAVRRAVLRDFQTGMIESHRLSPLSGATLISGYLLGPPVQVWLLYCASLFFGTIFAGHYGYSLGVNSVVPAWYFLQACMLTLSFMFTTLVLLTALGSSGKANVIGLLVMVSVFGGWYVVTLVPGLALVLGLMSAETLFYAMSKSQISDPKTVVVAATLQMLFGLIFFLAASRKVRVPERAMFSVVLGTILALLAGSTLVAGFGKDDTSTLMTRDFHMPVELQIIVSAAVFLLISFIPLISSAVDASLADRVSAFGEPVNVAQRRFLSFMPIVLGLMALLVVSGMCKLSGMFDRMELSVTETWPSLIAFRFMIFAAFTLSFWTDYQLLYVMATRGRGMIFVILLSCAILKILPFLLDLPVLAMVERSNVPISLSNGYFSGGSPIGTLTLLLVPGGKAIGGLLFQLVIAVVATVLGARARMAIAPLAGAARPAATNIATPNA